MSTTHEKYPFTYEVFVSEILGNVAPDMSRRALEHRFAKFMDSVADGPLSQIIQRHSPWPSYADSDAIEVDTEDVEKIIKKAMKKDGFCIGNDHYSMTIERKGKTKSLKNLSIQEVNSWLAKYDFGPHKQNSAEYTYIDVNDEEIIVTKMSNTGEEGKEREEKLPLPTTVAEITKGIKKLYKAGFVLFDDEDLATLMVVPKDTSRNGTIIDEEDVQFTLPLLATLSDENVLEDIMLRELFQILGFSLPKEDFDVSIDGGKIEFEILKEEREK